MTKSKKTVWTTLIVTLCFAPMTSLAEIDIVSDYTSVLDQQSGQFHFRGLVLGQPCEQSVPFELKRESTPVPPLLSSDFSYTGYFLNQLWEITYHCSEGGTLEFGSYSMQLKNEDQAKGFFNAVKNSLNRDLGLPQFDSTDPATRGHLARIGGFSAEAIAPNVLWENAVYKNTLKRTSAYKHRVLVTIEPATHKAGIEDNKPAKTATNPKPDTAGITKPMPSLSQTDSTSESTP